MLSGVNELDIVLSMPGKLEVAEDASAGTGETHQSNEKCQNLEPRHECNRRKRRDSWRESLVSQQ